MRRSLLARLLPLALLAAPAPALACSVTDEYRVPTNLELVRDAPLILLGRVTGERRGEEQSDRSILVEPVAAIKGALPPGPIAIADIGLAEGPELARYAVLSNPYELEGAHPLSYIGGCIRYIFPRGTTALFFLALAKDGSGYRPAGGPFSRWAEDVLTDDAPWLRLTRLYTRVAALPEAERTAALEAERANFAARKDDPVAQLMAADIARQMAGPNEAWNAIMRRGMGFEDSSPGEAADEGDEQADGTTAEPAPPE